MDTEFLRTDIQSDVKSGLRSVIDLLRNLNIIDQNTPAATLQPLRSLIGEEDAFTVSIDTFTFVVPPHTYDTLLTQLAHVKPERDVHYRNDNGVMYMNTNQNSYVVLTPEEAGHRARETLRTNNANATAQQLDAEFERARDAQIGENRTRTQNPPTWVLIQRQLPNDVRIEDSLLIFLDQFHKTVDWYTVMLLIIVEGRVTLKGASHEIDMG